MTTPCRRKITRWSYKQPITLSLTACPHRARHALQSTTSDRSHTVGFNCRLTCGGRTFGIEPAPPRNASIHASETECSPSSLTLCLAKRVTRSVAVDLRNDLRGVETPTQLILTSSRCFLTSSLCWWIVLTTTGAAN